MIGWCMSLIFISYRRRCCMRVTHLPTSLACVSGSHTELCGSVFELKWWCVVCGRTCFTDKAKNIKILQKGSD